MYRSIVIAILMVASHQINAQIERDKTLHFVGGTLYGLAGAGIAKHLSKNDRYWTFAGAVGGSFLVGLAKESIDQSQYGGWDNGDLLATVLGGMSVGFTIDVFTNKKGKNKKRLYSYNAQDDFTWANDPKPALALRFKNTPSLRLLSLPDTLLANK